MDDIIRYSANLITFFMLAYILYYQIVWRKRNYFKSKTDANKQINIYTRGFFIKKIRVYQTLTDQMQNIYYAETHLHAVKFCNDCIRKDNPGPTMLQTLEDLDVTIKEIAAQRGIKL